MVRLGDLGLGVLGGEPGIVAVEGQEDERARLGDGGLALGHDRHTATAAPTEIDLSWTASTDDIAVAGYAGSRDGTLIATAYSTTFGDIGLAAGSAHTYTVAAIDEAGNTSDASNAATTTAGPAASMPVSYTYDLADRLLSISTASGSTTTFTLDALGRHATETIDKTPTTTYSYLGTSDTIVAIANTVSAIDAVGNRVATGSAAGYGYLLGDLHGNTAAALNPACTAITDAFAYDAYGNTVASVTSALPTPWRYQGRILESAANTPDLYDFGARSYSPALGAFTSLDTSHGSAQNPHLLNGYLYADANPTTLVDPDGHCSLALAGANAQASAWCSANRGDPSTDVTPLEAVTKSGSSSHHGKTKTPSRIDTCSTQWNTDTRSVGCTVNVTAESQDGARARACSTQWNTDTRSPGCTVNVTAANSPPATNTAKGRPDCQGNWFCDLNNAWGTTGDLGRDAGGGLGDLYSHSIGGLVNHPADYLHDTFGLSYSATIGICADIGAGFGALGWGAHVTIAGGCVTASTNGNLGLLEYHGASFGPGNTGGHAGGDVNLLLSNGADAYDQGGPFVGTGGAISDGWAGGDINVQAGPDHCSTWTGSSGIVTDLTAGWSPGIGAEMYGVGGTLTNVFWSSKPAAPCPK